MRRLPILHRAGLPATQVLTLLRVWTQGAHAHIRRALPLMAAWATQMDNAVIGCVETLVDMSLSQWQREHSFLPIANGGGGGVGVGGLGMGCATLRRTSAWLGAWEEGLTAAAAAFGITSMLDMEERWPAFAACVRRMEAEHRALDGARLPSAKWLRCLAGAPSKLQAQLMTPVIQAAWARFERNVVPADVARVVAAGGKEAAMWLAPIPDADPLADAHACVALRLRLGCDVVASPPPPPTACCNCDANKRWCALHMWLDGGTTCIGAHCGWGSCATTQCCV